MEQSDFTYGAAPFGDAFGDMLPSGGGAQPTLSIYADRAHLRATMREDAANAGFAITATGPLEDLLLGDQRALDDIVLIDCPLLDATSLAALAQIDMRAATGTARLIVSTSMETLDDVFACMESSSPQLLVEPSRADRVIALGQARATMPRAAVRELSDDDRLMIMRLTEQVGQIAGRIDRLSPGPAQSNPAEQRMIEDSAAAAKRWGAGRSVLPEVGVLRRIIRQRQLRLRYIDAALFADPAWDMLLDLAAAHQESKRVSVTSLCIAAAVPPTTALRWIGQMIDAGLFRRIGDMNDRRRAFIELTEKALDGLGRYFGEIALESPAPV